MLDLTRGYYISLKVTINSVKFNLDSRDVTLAHDINNNYRDVVLIKDIDITSLYKYYFLLFIRKAYIGYILIEEVLSILRLAHIADVYARRL